MIGVSGMEYKGLDKEMEFSPLFLIDFVGRC